MSNRTTVTPRALTLALSAAFCAAALPLNAQPPGKGKPGGGGGGNDVYYVDVIVDSEGTAIQSSSEDPFEGTVDESPNDGAGARLRFSTGRDRQLQFVFPEGACADWIDDHGLLNPVEDNATVEIRLEMGTWGAIQDGSQGHDAHVKINPDTKRQEFWWVLRYHEDFLCEGCVNLSADVQVSRDGNVWTITGDLAWVHDNFNRPDGANCSVPFTFRVTPAP